MKKQIKEDTNIIAEIDINSSELKAGQILKSARTKSGKTIDQVADDLKIRKAYLEAIEKSDYENIPQYPYGVAFINSYASYLGFDGVAVANKYKKERNEGNEVVITQRVEKETIVEASPLPTKKNIMIAVVALVVISIIWSIASIGSDEEEISENAVNEVVEVSEEQNISETPIVTEITTTNETQENEVNVDNSSITIKDTNYVEEEKQPETNKTEIKTSSTSAPRIKVFEETWVEVKTNDKLYLSKVLQAGDEYVLPKRQGLILSVGKINGADLFVGDTKMNVISSSKKINIPLDSFLTKEDVQ